jgi:hypothetical protein
MNHSGSTSLAETPVLLLLRTARSLSRLLLALGAVGAPTWLHAEAAEIVPVAADDPEPADFERLASGFVRGGKTRADQSVAALGTSDEAVGLYDEGDAESGNREERPPVSAAGEEKTTPKVGPEIELVSTGPAESVRHQLVVWSSEAFLHVFAQRIELDPLGEDSPRVGRLYQISDQDLGGRAFSVRRVSDPTWISASKVRLKINDQRICEISFSPVDSTYTAGCTEEREQGRRESDATGGP